MEDQTCKQESTRQIRVVERSPMYWRVTFDHPPLNIFGPQTIPQLNEIVTALETNKSLKVVVFDSAVEGFFLTHYDSRIQPTSLPDPRDSSSCRTCWCASAARQWYPSR
jgi:enoyl-CoA hydratase/carnithine racemase